MADVNTFITIKVKVQNQLSTGFSASDFSPIAADVVRQVANQLNVPTRTKVTVDTLTVGSS